MDKINNPLLGTWQLVRWEITYGDGRAPTLPFGAQATGLIQYTGDGWMSACIARGVRGRLSSDSVRSAPEAERLAAFESYFQYAGPYEVKGAAGQQQVVHKVSHSLNPNFVGTEQVRNMTFAADGGLTLSASDTVPGTDVARHHRLIWSRASSFSGAA
ncbi:MULTISPECIES: lipocalin-like domain-containing protein [Polaromonas]|uniref:Lipocalin-like domain-containing protein n=1 Tax=Polaromonas aquatica TaxID=332657 RepID=A0ABW1TYJ3_9BURK